MMPWFYSAVVSAIYGLMAWVAPAVAETLIVACGFVILLVLPAIAIERIRAGQRDA